MNAQQFKLLSQVARDEWLASLTVEELAALNYDWRFWARENQIAPDGDWDTWLALAGRGFGKTEAGAQWIKEREENGARRIALIAETQKDLEEVMVPRLVSIYPPGKAPLVRLKPVRLTWASGAIAYGYNGTEPDQLRGPEFDTGWVDELAKYAAAQEVWDMLQFTMRYGNDPRVFVSTTPRPIPLLKKIMASKRTVVTRGSTFDNKDNLPGSFLDSLRDKYAGTRIGRQELDGEIVDDVVGALWTPENIHSTRYGASDSLPDMRRIVVAVDPSGTKGIVDAGDSIGIVVAGKGTDGRFYVLADYSCKLGPSGWAAQAIRAYRVFGADRVVAETNFGGAMVESTLRSVDPSVSYREVKASRGKIIRAEPIAALYEQGKVSHVGVFRELEEQMCYFTTSGYNGDGSPDRVDALVWAITSLNDTVEAKTETGTVVGLH